MSQLTQQLAEAPDRSFSVPMRDGVQLAMSGWGGFQKPAPIVLERTPYGMFRTDQAERMAGDQQPRPRCRVAASYTENGYIYLVQDCRGTGKSEGVFVKYLQEPDDTNDTLQWIRRQSWCDGFIAMVGFSYSAACQLSALGDRKTDPDAVVLDCGGFDDALTSGIRQGGVLLLKQATWAHAQALREARNRNDSSLVDELRSTDVLSWLKKGPWDFGHTPLANAADLQESLSRFWQSGSRSAYWEQAGFRKTRACLTASKTDAFLITSWHDTSLRSSVNNFSALNKRQRGNGHAVLLIGPWTHGDRWCQVAGEADFGPSALPEAGLGQSVADMRLEHLSRSRSSGELRKAAVHWFQMGGGGGERNAKGHFIVGGRWRETDDWPPKFSRRISLSLTDEGLSPVSQAQLSRSFISDPENPYPTLGGAINSGAPIMEGGMRDQRPVDGRPDVIRLETSPLQQDFELAGPVTVRVFCRSTAADFDLAARLVAVFPHDGPSLNISDGILRARYREGMAGPLTYIPGELVRLDVSLNPVGFLVRAGHRLRLDITGSNFPCFEVNPQTGGALGKPGQRRPAEIAVVSNDEYRSVLTVTSLYQGKLECLFS